MSRNDPCTQLFAVFRFHVFERKLLRCRNTQMFFSFVSRRKENAENKTIKSDKNRRC